MRIIRVVFRCVQCGFRLPVSGPETTDWTACRPAICGRCHAQTEFVREAA